MSTYKLPMWACKPSSNRNLNSEDKEGDNVDWSIEEIKNGTVLNKYDLFDVAVVTFGRFPLNLNTDNDGVPYKSIVTAHESEFTVPVLLKSFLVLLCWLILISSYFFFI